jgi:hypothetical protein
MSKDWRERLERCAARFWSRVERKSADECWVWTGSLTGKPGLKYGNFWIHPFGTLRVHRVSWELANGPIPSGMFVCHKCDNSKCCNPAHLFLGTASDNNEDMYAKNRRISQKSAKRDGDFARGGENHKAKLTETIVAEIRTSTESTVLIARRLGLNRDTISRARYGHRWSWITDPAPWPRPEQKR